MARLSRGILGGGRGKVGNVVMSSWKGIDTLRSLPISVANPRTAGQVGQRTKLSACVALGQELASTVIASFFQRVAVRMSGFNQFVKSNVGAFTSLGVLTYAQLIISYGKLTSVVLSNFEPDSTADSIFVDWTDNSGEGNAIAGDKVKCVFYNQTQNYWLTAYVGVDRSVESITIPDLNVAVSDVCHIWVSVNRADNSMFSNTVYQTAVAV